MSKIITNAGHARLEKVTIELYIRNDYDGEPDPLDRLAEYDIRVEVNDEGTEYTGFQIQHHKSEEYVTEFVRFKEHGIDKNQILEIKEDLKTIKSNRPYLNENQLIAMACAMQDIKSNKLIDFAVVESIYREANS